MSRNAPREFARDWANNHLTQAQVLCRNDPDKAVRHLAEARKLMNRFNLINRDVGFSNKSVSKIESNISKAYTLARRRK